MNKKNYFAQAMAISNNIAVCLLYVGRSANLSNMVSTKLGVITKLNVFKGTLTSTWYVFPIMCYENDRNKLINISWSTF